MECRIEGTATELEVPLNPSAVGAPIRIAIRAGDILVGNEEPRGLSARNVLRGRLVELTRTRPDDGGGRGCRRAFHRAPHAKRRRVAQSHSLAIMCG